MASLKNAKNNVVHLHFKFCSFSVFCYLWISIKHTKLRDTSSLRYYIDCRYCKVKILDNNKGVTSFTEEVFVCGVKNQGRACFFYGINVIILSWNMNSQTPF